MRPAPIGAGLIVVLDRLSVIALVEGGIALMRSRQGCIRLGLRRIRTHALSVRAAILGLHSLMHQTEVPSHDSSLLRLS